MDNDDSQVARDKASTMGKRRASSPGQDEKETKKHMYQEMALGRLVSMWKLTSIIWKWKLILRRTQLQTVKATVRKFYPVKPIHRCSGIPAMQ